MRLLAIFLLPFSWLYNLATRFRNHLYDIGYKPSFEFDVFLISVGNLSVGGTGKTPMIEYLIRLLKSRYKLATLSRGYGRQTRGFILATEKDNATLIGDEPRQFYEKYGLEIKVAVGEERALAVPEILFHHPATSIILLDDAYQHRSIKANVNILLSDYYHPFYEDWVLPAGRLRESRSSARRADLLIITKCPDDLSESKMMEIEAAARPYLRPKLPVFFTGIRYMSPKLIWQENMHMDITEVFVFTGIARERSMLNYLQKTYEVIGVMKFGDHHRYTRADIQRVIHAYTLKNKPGAVLMTTEKDMVKLRVSEFKKEFKGLPIYYLPVESFFLKNGHIFDNKIEKMVAKEVKQ